MANGNTYKTNCPRGHKYSGLNSEGKRICKVCLKKYGLEWQHRNKSKVKIYNKRYRLANPNYSKQWDQKNPDRRKEINKRQNRTEKRIQYHRKWQRDNPRSNTSYPSEVRIAMENVRVKDNNTCQWYACGKTCRETSIFVHHIFPKAEYPDLATIEAYMICYCQFHHTLWHEARKDKCTNFIRNWYRKQPMEILISK